MRFIDKQQKILRKIIQKRRRRLPAFTVIQVSGIIFNAIAIAQFLHHFQIKLGTLFEPLRLNKPVGFFQLNEPVHKLRAYIIHGSGQIIAVRNVMARRINDCL